MPIVGKKIKDPDELIIAGRWGIDWIPDLVEYEKITHVDMQMLDESGTDCKSDMLSDITIIEDRYTTATVKKGESGATYRWIHRVTTSAGNILEDYIAVVVISNESLC